MQSDTTMTIRLPKDLIDELDRLAEQDEVSRSLLVRRMLLSAVARRG